MPKYAYKAKNSKNETIQGSANADSERDLVEMFRNQGIIVFSIKLDNANESPQTKSSKKKIKNISVKEEEIAIFCRQMSTMLNAGVSILESLEDLVYMTNNKAFSELLQTVSSDIKEGATFSGALAKYTNVFGNVFVALVGVGEKSGQLGKVLFDLSAYLENAVKLKRKVKSASSYPLFIGGFFVVVVLGIILFLIPRFKTMFTSFGAKLPLPTRIAIFVSDNIIHYFPFFIIIVIALVVAVKSMLRTDKGRLLADTFILKAPILGPIVTKVVLARFFQTLATLITSGNDIVSSLEISSAVADNVYVKGHIEQLKNKVIEGSNLSTEMAKFPFFPPMIVKMTAVGEKSGKLDEMFMKISEYYSDEVNAVVAALSSIIEPVLIVFLGIIIGVVVIVMYLPIFKMASAVMGPQG
ncbi:MAG: type II secretion system F family protein [Elusimicrobia bacterium]|nr:type II secretion system F family protein [Candidatus Liberimonas magnetica]